MGPLPVHPAASILGQYDYVKVVEPGGSPIASVVVFVVAFVLVVSFLIISVTLLARRGHSTRCPRCGATRRARFCSVCGQVQPD
jgi:hypothetical protein